MRKKNFLDVTTRWHSDCCVLVSVRVGQVKNQNKVFLITELLKGNPRDSSNLKYLVNS